MVSRRQFTIGALSACWVALAGCTRLERSTGEPRDDGAASSPTDDRSADDTRAERPAHDDQPSEDDSSCDDPTSDTSPVAIDVTGVDRRPRPRLLETVTVDVRASSDGPCPERYEYHVRLEHEDDGELDGKTVSGSLEPSTTKSQSLTVRLLETGPTRIRVDGTVVDEFEVRPRPAGGEPSKLPEEPDRSDEPTVETGGEATIYVVTDDGSPPTD